MEPLIPSLTLMVLISEISGDLGELTAVSSFESLTLFYRDIRNNQRPSDEEATHLTEKKTSICQAITGSHYFYSMGFEPVNLESVFKKLKHPKYKEIFRELFHKRAEIDENCVTIENGETNVTYPYVYTNDYNVKKVKLNLSHVIDEVFDVKPPTSSRAMDSEDLSYIGGGRNNQPTNNEHVFVCLTQKRSGTVHSSYLVLNAWYVSKEYELKKGPHSPGTETIVGRFIFEKRTSSFLKVVALAEEAARPYFLYEMHEEDYYLNTLRDGHEPAKESIDDPLCRLIDEPDRHARLCNAVFSASIFIRQLRPVTDGTKELLESKCSWLQVTFKMPSIKNKIGTKEYFEWMIPCKAELVAIKKEIVQYNISWAYKPNTVIVYDANIPGEQSVYSICSNVNIPD